MEHGALTGNVVCFPLQDWQDTVTVVCSIYRHSGVQDGGAGSRQVVQRRQCITRRTWLHRSRPTHDKRDAVSAFPGITLHSAIGTGCAVMETFGKLRTPVGTVVAGKDDQCIFCQAEADRKSTRLNSSH